MTKKETDNKNLPNTETDMDKKTARRKVMRNTFLGGAVISTSAVPDKWAKPVLNSVLLPAHAATTDDTGDDTVVNTTPSPTTTVAGTTAPPTTAPPTTAPPTTAPPTTAPPTTPPPTTTKIMASGINHDVLDYDIV